MLDPVWNVIDNIGLKDGDDARYYKEIVFLNRFVAICFIVIAIYIPVEAMTFGWAMIPGIATFGVLMLGSLLLVNLKQYACARIYFLVLTNLFVAFLVIQCGGVLDNEYLFLPISLLGLPLFRYYKPIVYGNFFFSAALFLISVKLAPVVGPWVEIPPDAANRISATTNILVFIFFFVLLASSRKASSEYNAAIKRYTKTIEQKNEEMRESLDYARRLQEALTPPQTTLDENGIEHFCLAKPKDYVSGDFPYFFKRDDGSLWVAAGDCTGHGVPGALISVMCIAVLSDAMKKPELQRPSEVLDYASAQVSARLNIGRDDQVKDGMDISLVKIVADERGYQLEWSGANNPLWIRCKEDVLANTPNLKKLSDKLYECQGDKRPVGMYFTTKPFTNHKLKVCPSTKLFLFSDGFADQFGGEQDKKMKKKRFVEELLTGESENMRRFGVYLDNFFSNWKGSNEQTDDVLVIGLKLND